MFFCMYIEFKGNLLGTNDNSFGGDKVKKIILFVTLFIFGLTFSILMRPVAFHTKTDQSSSSEIPTAMFTSKKNQDLLTTIQSYAQEFDQEPVDATVDKIWKAIPGYNGITVDVEASYLKMIMIGGFNKKRMLYRETKPKIHLKDLPPSPIYKGNPEKPMVSLLINVAWGNEFIPKIIETLEENKVTATFFFDGSWVKKNADLALLIKEQGHEIGNHAYSHPDLKQKTRTETIEELTMTNEIIYSTVGIKPEWFAPPSGSFKQETIDIAHELGMFTILWTVDTVDWKKPATTEMVKRVTSQISNGSMILMHPTKPTAEGLEQIIKAISTDGYQIGTVSDMMDERRIERKNEPHK